MGAEAGGRPATGAAMTLLDANVLVYAINVNALQHAASRAVLQAALDGHLLCVLFPQVLLEFFAVVTSARRVQRPLAPEAAWQQVAALRAGLPVLGFTPDILTALDGLVRARRPRWKHDERNLVIGRWTREWPKRGRPRRDLPPTETVWPDAA